jgi:diaminohydroxyphosphoribosylaminopyrimidine deaminase/5-amino-6-(5-phosphoribosylamino)uracil reductase
MWRCLELAKRGAGLVAPNPMVGAVLIHKERILGEGWHKKFGEAHAEPNCIRDAEEKGFSGLIPSSTMYVNLEPCVHFGKTPPCADLLIRYRIPKLVIATRDPFEAVNGKGIEKLKVGGVNVVCGVLEKEARELNKRFFTFQEKKRPYIILKWAQTKDGFIGSRKERLIVSNAFSERLAHQWRAEESAIMVGANTAALDDPLLTNRHWSGHSPIRILLDPQLRVDTKLRMFNGESPLVVLNNKKHSFGSDLDKTLSAVNYFKTDTSNIKEICDAVYQLKIQSLIVEGGAAVLQSFIDAGTWDEARLVTSSRSAENLSEPVPAPQLGVHHKTGEQEIESDLLEYFHNPA